MTLRKFAKSAIKGSMRPVCDKVCAASRFVPPGHFYSPFSNDEDFAYVHNGTPDAHADWAEFEVRNNSSAGIDFNESAQLELLEKLGEAYSTMPEFPVEKEDGFRYFFGNHYFSFPDATVFYCLIRTLQPRKIIDVAGGNTTTLMLDMNDTCFREDPMDITLIEPYPERIEGYMKAEAGLTKLYCKVQEVDPELFGSLEAGDILFLDTTHVSKMGGEVNYLAFNVLPRLKPGVIVHIHEVFYPFEYPAGFYADGKGWNEIYLWRAFLMHNREYEILLFNNWLAKKHAAELRQHLPGYFRKGRPHINVQIEGSSLWLRKVGRNR